MPVRSAVRALLVDPTGAVFLMGVVEPVSRQRWWVSPGGAIEPGEHHLSALRRELMEELGLELPEGEVGPAIWHRSVTFSWDGSEFDQHETYYLVPTARFDPVRCLDGDGLTVSQGEPRWWTTDELRRASDRIAPAALPALLDELRDRGVPTAPIDISALVD